MFWIGFAVGIMATLAFLVTEHLIGQLDRKTRTALGKAFSPMLCWHDRHERRRQEHKEPGRPLSMK